MRATTFLPPPPPQLRELNDPAARLYEAARRYTDALRVATEHLVGPKMLADLDRADHLIPGITGEPAWPTLRAHLLRTAETGKNPLHQIAEALLSRDIRTAGDMAAVIYWSLTEFGRAEPGPLPWLPDIPPTIRQNPDWGDYLTSRAQLVTHLVTQVQDHARRHLTQPVWAPQGSRADAALVADIALWRAVNGIEPSDPRPTGGPQVDTAADRWKQQLDDAVRAMDYPAGKHTAPRPVIARTYDQDRRPQYGPHWDGPAAPGP